MTVNIGLGWNNTATIGSILAYVFYWLFIIVTLIYLKWKEGRVTFCGLSSKVYKDRNEQRVVHDRTECNEPDTPGWEGKKGYADEEMPLGDGIATLDLRD